MADIFEQESFPAPRPETQPGNIQEDLTDDMVLMNLLADIGGSDSDAKVSVYRISGASRKLSFIRSYLPQEFSLEQLQLDVGAGDYRVQVRAKGGLVANKAISIEENPTQKVNVQAIVTSSSSSEISQLADVMVKGFQSLGEMLVQNRPTPQFDPSQMRREMMQDMLTMKELFGSNQQSSNPNTAIEMFVKGMEMAKDVVPKDGETSVMDVLLESLKTFGAPIAQAAMMSRTAPIMEAPQAPQNPQLAAPITGSVAPQPQENENMNPALSHYVNMLVALAKENRDPFLYADLIVDQVSETEIREFISDPDLVGTLAKYNPEAANYGGWIMELKSAILEILTPPENGSSVQSGQPQSLIIQNATITDLSGSQPADSDNRAAPANP